MINGLFITTSALPFPEARAVMRLKMMSVSIEGI